MASLEAIERVRYAHQLGAKLSFEQAVPRSLLETKVRNSLKQSAALERFWGITITADDLAAEVRRMVTDTRMPERLAEVVAALGDDPMLVQECLARPVVADRLARQAFALDERIHGKEAPESGTTHDDAVAGRERLETAGPRRSWEDWWQEVSPILIEDTSVIAEEAGDLDLSSLRADAASSMACTGPDGWDNNSLAGGAHANHSGSLTVWTGTEVLVWDYQGGERYDPATGSWAPMSVAGQPPYREGYYTVIWTGSEMIVWGGFYRSSNPPYPWIPLSSGGQYNPATDSWTPIQGAPVAQYGHSAVWTGTRMLVFGGYGGNSPGGASYDPTAHTWTTFAGPPGEGGRAEHSAVWNGSRMLVWGGACYLSPCPPGGLYTTGWSFDPGSGSWTPISVGGSPSGRTKQVAFSAGSTMVVWGGYAGNGVWLNSGGVYHSRADAWTPISTAGAPSGSPFNTAVWDGRGMFVWSGMTTTGFRYDPAAQTWTPLPPAPAGIGSGSITWTGSGVVIWGSTAWAHYDAGTNTWAVRSFPTWPRVTTEHRAVWTGNLMVVLTMRNRNLAPNLQDIPSAYDPALDLWHPIAVAAAPPLRENPTVVWTGQEIILWGGGTTLIANDTFNTGGRYDPIGDAWHPTSTAGAPSPRTGHSAVWDGSRMIVWGGTSVTCSGCASQYYGDGGRYDPVLDQWSSLSTSLAPSSRSYHLAGLVAGRMVVWSGWSGSTVGGGGRYDPSTDSWQAMSTASEPMPRFTGTAVSTGTELLVWGGTQAGFPISSGGRYDPLTNSWTPMSESDAPAPQAQHTMVWTGTEAIVWGGALGLTNAGSRYDPAFDTWSPMTSLNAPAPRGYHSAVWTGDAMIVFGGRSSQGWVMTGGRYHVAFGTDQDGDGTSVCLGDCDDAHEGVYPRAPQGCDGLNNDCASPGWPSTAGTNEGDDDGDGFSECQMDCSDSNPNVWGPPGEVPELEFEASYTRLRWLPPAQLGAFQVVYDLIRTAQPTDFAMTSTCLVSDQILTEASDAQVPPIGGFFYYLARAQNGCGEGPAGLQVARQCP